MLRTWVNNEDLSIVLLSDVEKFVAGLRDDFHLEVRKVRRLEPSKPSICQGSPSNM